MITKEEVDFYIEKIPPVPKVIRETISLLKRGELTKASKVAQQDPALSSYLRTIINKPIYGFSKEIKDITQIFSILGINSSLKIIYSYMMNLLSPKEWYYFNLNKNLFNMLQDELNVNWQKILNHLKFDKSDAESAVALLPATIIVCEALFKEKKENIELLKSAKNLDLDTILKRLTGYSLTQIYEKISKKWELDESTVEIVKVATGKSTNENPEILLLGKWMHLLLFFELSKPQFIEANLNDFIEFNIELVADIYEDFNDLMELKE